MKKLYFIPFLFLTITCFAQKQFVVQGGTTQTFSDINAAIAAASPGDTIYFPGGGFSLNPTTIDKTLHWRGVGHYPDSTAATGFTQILGSTVLTGNCDNSTFEGIYFQYNLSFGSNDDECTGVEITRCRIDGALSFRTIYDTSNGNQDLNGKVSESVIGTINGYNAKNIRFEKNLIFGIINDLYQCLFNHNSINTYQSSNRVISNCHNCQFSNNVFGNSYGFYNGSANCNFENNLFKANLIYDPTISTFTGSGNITNVSGDIYSHLEGDVRYFNYQNNYHLNTSATGTDGNGNTGIGITGKASDGTNAGIYGTSLPYKEGAVPYAPHIQTADIDNNAINGNLGVQIKVAAQER